MEKVKFIPKSEHNELIKRCNPEKGDLLLSKNGTIGLTKVIDWDFEFSIFVSLCLIKFIYDKLIPQYFMYIFQSNVTDEQIFKSSKKTSVTNLHLDKIRELVLLIPPLPEQKQIAKYLDHKTAQIDSLIEKKKRLIELLKEERTAVINQAVTKGLDPNVPMKDSGIEWLGEIPAHWEVKRFKYFFKLITEKNGNSSNKQIALENIESWTGRLIETTSVFAGDGILFDKGDILFGKLRPYLAKVLYVDYSGSAVGDIYVFRPTEGVDSRFGFYKLLSESFINIVNGSTYGAKMPRASWDFIGNLEIALPTLEEQKRIFKNIENETTRIDTIISKSEKEIELLQEYRTALISEVVTGKIDVREEKI